MQLQGGLARVRKLHKRAWTAVTSDHSFQEKEDRICFEGLPARKEAKGSEPGSGRRKLRDTQTCKN